MITLRGVTTIPLYSPSGTRPTSRFAAERNCPAEVLRGIVEAQTNTASSANRVQRPRWTPMATLKRNRTVIVGRGIWPCSLGLERSRTPRQRPRNRRLPLRLRRLVLRISHRSGSNRSRSSRSCTDQFRGTGRTGQRSHAHQHPRNATAYRCPANAPAASSLLLHAPHTFTAVLVQPVQHPLRADTKNVRDVSLRRLELHHCPGDELAALIGESVLGVEAHLSGR